MRPKRSVATARTATTKGMLYAPGYGHLTLGDLRDLIEATQGWSSDSLAIVNERSVVGTARVTISEATA